MNAIDRTFHRESRPDRAIELETRHSAPNYAPLPVVLTRGEDSYLWDTAGKRYVDMMSAYSAASHGHAHPRIVAALVAQAQQLAVTSRAFHNDRLPALLRTLATERYDPAVRSQRATGALPESLDLLETSNQQRITKLFPIQPAFFPLINKANGEYAQKQTH